MKNEANKAVHKRLECKYRPYLFGDNQWGEFTRCQCQELKHVIEFFDKLGVTHCVCFANNAAHPTHPVWRKKHGNDAWLYHLYANLNPYNWLATSPDMAWATRRIRTKHG